MIRIIRINEAICPVCECPAIGGATHPGCRTRYTLDGLTSFFRYDGIVRKAVKALKYRFVSDLAREFISLVPLDLFSNHKTIQQYNNSYILVPIPLHSSRFRERGFNQAEVLGRLLSERLHIPSRTDILCRKKKTIPQVEMKTRELRLTNMNNVFQINQKAMKQYNNLTIILIDDVFTTGATMRSAANILKRNGVKFVWAVTMAR